MKAFIVQYYGGGEDGCNHTNIFVTNSKETAEAYVSKFNKILKKWKSYYRKYEGYSALGNRWLKDEYIEQHHERWYALRNITECYYQEIDVR